MSQQEIRAGVERFRNGGSNAHSFSSSLLDQIYRSIDDGDDKRSGELKFYTHNNVLNKQAKPIGKSQGHVEDEEISRFRRALLIEKKVPQRRRSQTEAERKFQLRQNDREEDVLFFNSTSSSSDSSFGGFSSSDSESIHGSKSLTPSCFAKFRPKPVRTAASAAPLENTAAKQQRNQFVENKESRDFDEIAMVKSKTRALKIYSNLKKTKQPISPGGRISSFLNSIFTAKKSGNSVKSTAASEDPNSNRRSKPGQISTCSSAASFSRSCLSKNSSLSSEKLRNADRRTVRLYPVSRIIEQPKFQVKDDPQRTAARNAVTDYQKIKKRSDLLMRNFHHLDNDLDEDDRTSCSSSDLFELDHLTVMSGDRYSKELPVYETTTHVESNRAIRHG